MEDVLGDIKAFFTLSPMAIWNMIQSGQDPTELYTNIKDATARRKVIEDNNAASAKLQAEIDAKQFSDSQKLHMNNLYQTLNDQNRPLAERKDAHYKIGEATGNIEPWPMQVPTETKGEKPFDYSGYEKNQADIKLKEAGIGLKKSQAKAYDALAGKRTKDGKDRENSLKELNSELDNIEFQWKEIPRKVTGAIKDEYVEKARQLEDRMVYLNSEISKLRGAQKEDDEYKIILEGIKAIQGLNE